MNVEDLAASRFKPIRQAREQIAKATAAHSKSIARLEELRGQVGPVERRDKEALGRALVAGKTEPASEAAKLRAEIEQEERRAEALRLAVETAQGQVAKLVKTNRGAWHRRAMQELVQAKARYEAAICELEAARDGLSDEAMLVAWLDGGAGVAAANDSLAGRVGIDLTGKVPMSFAATLAELRADLEALAAHPDNRDEPQLRPHFELARGAVAAMRVSDWER